MHTTSFFLATVTQDQVPTQELCVRQTSCGSQKNDRCGPSSPPKWALESLDSCGRGSRNFEGTLQFFKGPVRNQERTRAFKGHNRAISNPKEDLLGTKRALRISFRGPKSLLYLLNVYVLPKAPWLWAPVKTSPSSLTQEASQKCRSMNAFIKFVCALGMILCQLVSTAPNNAAPAFNQIITIIK